MSQGLSFFDGDRKLVVSNRRFGDIQRLAPDKTQPGTPLVEILDYRLANGSLPEMSSADFLARRETPSCAAKPYDIIEPLRDGRIISMHYQSLLNGAWVTTHEDVTERLQAEGKLVFMANHDALTGPPKPAAAQQAIAQSSLTTQSKAPGIASRTPRVSIGLHRARVVHRSTASLQPVGRLLRPNTARPLRASVEAPANSESSFSPFKLQPTCSRQSRRRHILSRRLTAISTRPRDPLAHRTDCTCWREG